jgi:hypothetical protein
MMGSVDLLGLLQENNFRRRSEAYTKITVGLFWTVAVSVPISIVPGAVVWWLVRHIHLPRLGLLAGAVVAAGALAFIFKNADPAEVAPGSWDNFIDMGPRGIVEGRTILRTLTPEDKDTIELGMKAVRTVAEGDQPDDVPTWLEDLGVVTRTKHGAVKLTKRGEELAQ